MKTGAWKKTWAVAALSLAILAGCSTGSNEANQAANSGANNGGNAPAEVKSELTYASAKDINDMNPHLYTGSMPAQGMVYESLVENTKDGIKPLLAESWELSDEGKTYTFKLRQGVTFHDGEPFNAEAVKANIEAVLANAQKHAWIKLSTKITSVEATDEYTVVLKLSETYYPALLELSMTRPFVFISPKDFKDGGTKDGVNGFHGTGPYKLVKHEPEQYAEFEANEEYWGGEAAIQKITSKVLPAGETTFLALQKGEIDFVFTDDRGTDSIDIEAMKQLVDSGKYQLVRSDAMNTKMIVANSSKQGSPAAETAVRQAIWHAIDRDTISEAIFEGTEKAAHRLFSENVNYANVELEKREYDLEQAKSLLDEAGWKLGEGEAVRKKDGAELSMKLYYDSNSSSQKTQAEFIQSGLSQIGVKLELIGEESSSVASRRASGDYDLLFNQTWGLAYDPQSTIAAFTTESSYLHTTKGIAQAEELYSKIAEVMVSTDEAARQALYADILGIVHEEAVFIPLTNGSVTVIAPAALKGIDFKQTQFELPFERFSY
ncbi:nickel ABC transporter substrate-binding protein [Paenibacillus sp. PL2-23]|uniref:staphylopine-dependent metal ABC transporter substrate-binding lipoprotein n=1 Tax=Paenibacillus sp. PL2-23 TaxID=2100729 RepID=UPI0030F9C0E7